MAPPTADPSLEDHPCPALLGESGADLGEELATGHHAVPLPGLRALKRQGRQLRFSHPGAVVGRPQEELFLEVFNRLKYVALITCAEERFEEPYGLC
jgi:hypothetical protein